MEGKRFTRKSRSSNISASDEAPHSIDETDKGTLLKSKRKKLCKTDENSVWKLLTCKEVLQALFISLSFGIALPFTDSGTDIRLSIRLFLNNHPRWAFAILTPILINTLFTLVICNQIERKEKNNCSWLFYAPLVILQIYPQFCVFLNS